MLEFKEVTTLTQAAQEAVRKQRRTAEEQKNLVTLWHNSGLNAAQFCQQHNIKKKTFSAWRTRHSAVTKGVLPASFSLPKKPAVLGTCRIKLPNGIQLSFESDTDRFAMVLSTLKELATWNLT